MDIVVEPFRGSLLTVGIFIILCELIILGSSGNPSLVLSGTIQPLVVKPEVTGLPFLGFSNLWNANNVSANRFNEKNRQAVGFLEIKHLFTELPERALIQRN